MTRTRPPSEMHPNAAIKPLVVIRKYSNRRLYDTQSKRYINLEDLFALVRSGQDVQVLHARSGHDLTQETLQSMLDELRPLARSLPESTLYALLRLNDADWAALLQKLPQLLIAPPPPPPLPPQPSPPPANDIDSLRLEIEAIKRALLTRG